MASTISSHLLFFLRSYKKKKKISGWSRYSGPEICQHTWNGFVAHMWTEYKVFTFELKRIQEFSLLDLPQSSLNSVHGWIYWTSASLPCIDHIAFHWFYISHWIFKKYYVFIYLCVCVFADIHRPQSTFQSKFSPPVVRISGVELRSLDLEITAEASYQPFWFL